MPMKPEAGLIGMLSWVRLAWPEGSSTPMSSSAIITARWAGVSPWTVTTLWNAWFTSSALLLAWAAIVLAFLAWR